MKVGVGIAPMITSLQVISYSRIKVLFFGVFLLPVGVVYQPAKENEEERKIMANYELLKSILTMEEKVYFVMQEKRVWKYDADINRCCWVTMSRKKVSQNRRKISDANNDFRRLGFKIQSGPGVIVQCHDNIVQNKLWVRHIVQCATITQ